MDVPPHPESTVSLENLWAASTPISDDHDDKYGVPTLEELGEWQTSKQAAIWEIDNIDVIFNKIVFY